MVNVKVHAAIISVIVIAIYFVWQTFIYKEPVEPETIVISGYALQISRATYGLDCLRYFRQNMDPLPGVSSYDIERYKENLRSNNVLSKISSMCNGKPKCTIRVKPENLGFEGFPECGVEKLDLEFRCFAVDNIRKVSFSIGDVATLDCDKFVIDQD